MYEAQRLVPPDHERSWYDPDLEANLNERRRPEPAGPLEPRAPTPIELPAGLSRGLSSYGEVFYRDQFFPLDHKHGRFKLESALVCDDDLLDRLGAGLTPKHVRRAAYLDIETTGLSGDAVGPAFMVGIGTFEGLWFRVRQYFLMNLGGERAMLVALTETIERCQCVVTFNGKSFDLPQLAARFALAGLPDPFAGLPHIDLLHPARLLFSVSLDSCRLAEVEQHLLRFRRNGDIPGALIPAAYESYLRRRSVRGLHPIFEHNSHDVVSLVAFVAYLNEAAGTDVIGSAGHHYRLGKWDEKRGRADQALDNHRIAWESDPHGDDGGQAMLRLARCLTRAGEWRECVELWRRELERTGRVARRVRACIELAKLHEHRLRAPHVALSLCREAIEHIETSPSPRSFEPSRLDLGRRIQRLEQRVRAGDGSRSS